MIWYARAEIKDIEKINELLLQVSYGTPLWQT